MPSKNKKPFDPAPYSKAFQAIELGAITLKESKTQISKPPHGIKLEAMEMDFKINPKWEIKDPHLIVTLSLELSGGSKEKEPQFLFGATYWVFYTLSESDLDDQALDYFAKHSTPQTLYPYFREFVDSTSRKMGLAQSILLPLLKPSVSK